MRRLVYAVVVTVAVAAATARASAQGPAVENPANPATYDPYFAEQWALRALGAPAAWLRSTGVGVRVGIVDTGVDLGHEDLAGKIVASTSCVGAAGVAAACRGSGQDDEGHGTHVAGIVAADTFNGKGVAAVAPGSLLVVAKVLDASGSGTVEDVNAGIKWVVDHGARVVNLSLEADGGLVSAPAGQSLADGVEYAWHHGAIPVVAAGNATPSLFGPTGYAGVDAVVVGATGRAGEPAWNSSPLSGARWGIMAPGGDQRGPEGTASCAGPLAAGCIVSTGWFAGRADAYADDEGTSMAAPQVSGVLALLLAEGLSPVAAVDRMLATATPLACGGGCAGAADAAAAAVDVALPRTFGRLQGGPASTTTTADATGVGTGPPPLAAGPPPPAPVVTAPAGAPSAGAGSHVAAGRVEPGTPRRGGAAVVIAAIVLLVAVGALLGAEATAVAARRRV